MNIGPPKAEKLLGRKPLRVTEISQFDKKTKIDVLWAHLHCESRKLVRVQAGVRLQTVGFSSSEDAQKSILGQRFRN